MITPLLVALACCSGDSRDLPFVPAPLEVQRREASFRLDRDVVIVFEEREAPRAGERSLAAHAHVLAEELELLTGIRPPVVSAPRAGARSIELRFAALAGVFAANEGDEVHSYSLDVSGERIEVIAPYSKGVAHGTATLLQALEANEGGPTVPGLVIHDSPASAYRSVMIDVARNPHSIGVIEDVVRLARLYKLRYVHLHLTDDQHFTFPFEPVTSKLLGNATFTRQALRELVAYAEARGVTLIPEIDLPGHSSRLIESGYLPGAANHADVASPGHFERIHALIDDVLEVFSSSPYLHIGGDESGAGEALVPFLASMQRHVRSRGRRLVVWEGFRGAPTEALPPRGEDRILVAAWESSYNPPWDLLAAGYELVNASWKPLYVVGGGSRIHPGSTAGRKWSPREIAAWDKDSFWHWEPGRPVFEDAGPEDPDRGDSVWSAAYVGGSDRIVGAQVSVWEQHESSVVDDLRGRIPVFAERVWSGSRAPVDDLLQRAALVDARVWPLVQPVAILPEADPSSPVASLYRAYRGDAVAVRFVNRTRLPGVVRHAVGPFQGSLTWIEFPDLARPPVRGPEVDGTLRIEGGAVVRAQLFAANGRPIGGGTWARFLDWPDRVRVTEFDVGRRALASVPDLAALDPESALASYTLPMIRGPLEHVAVKAQRFDAMLRPPALGAFTLSMKTQSGRASLYLDLDHDGTWSEGERLVADTPSSEELQSIELTLGGEPVALRVDHATALPRPVLVLFLEGPGTNGREEITRFLDPLAPTDGGK